METEKKTRNYIEPMTVRAYFKTIRVSADMIPEPLRGKPLWFMARADKRRKLITLKPVLRPENANGNGSHSKPVIMDGPRGSKVQGHQLWSWYSAGRGKSPYISAGMLYQEIGWRPHPSDSLVLKAKVAEDGTIEVRIGA